MPATPQLPGQLSLFEGPEDSHQESGDVDAPTLAQQWHEDQKKMHADANEDSSCWCCCGTCEEMNPYFEDAEPSGH